MMIAKIITLIFILNCTFARVYTANQYQTIRDYFTRHRKVGLVSHMADMFKEAKTLTAETNNKGLKYKQKNRGNTELDSQLQEFVNKLQPKQEFLSMADLSNEAAGEYYDQLINLFKALKNWKKESPFKNIAMNYANKIEAELLLCGVPYNGEQYQPEKKEKKQPTLAEKKRIGGGRKQQNTKLGFVHKLGFVEPAQNVQGAQNRAKVQSIVGGFQEVKNQEENLQTIVNPEVVVIDDDKSQVDQDEIEEENELYNGEDDLERKGHGDNLFGGLNEDEEIKSSSNGKSSVEKFVTRPIVDALYQESPKIQLDHTSEFDGNGNLISSTPIIHTDLVTGEQYTTLPKVEPVIAVKYPAIEPVIAFKYPMTEPWNSDDNHYTYEQKKEFDGNGNLISETPITVGNIITGEESIMRPKQEALNIVKQMDNEQEKFIQYPAIEPVYIEAPKIELDQTREYDANGNLLSSTPIVHTDLKTGEKYTTRPSGQEPYNMVKRPRTEAWRQDAPSVTYKKTVTKNEKGEIIHETPIYIEEDAPENLAPLFDDIPRTQGNHNAPTLNTGSAEISTQTNRLKKIRRIIIIENVDCKECTEDPAIRKFMGLSN